MSIGNIVINEIGRHLMLVSGNHARIFDSDFRLKFTYDFPGDSFDQRLYDPVNDVLVYRVDRNRAEAWDLLAGRLLWSREKYMKDRHGRQPDLVERIALWDGTAFLSYGKGGPEALNIVTGKPDPRWEKTLAQYSRKEAVVFHWVRGGSGRMLFSPLHPNGVMIGSPHSRIPSIECETPDFLYFLHEKNMSTLRLRLDGLVWDEYQVLPAFLYCARENCLFASASSQTPYNRLLNFDLEEIRPLPTWPIRCRHVFDTEFMVEYRTWNVYSSADGKCIGKLEMRPEDYAPALPSPLVPNAAGTAPAPMPVPSRPPVEPLKNISGQEMDRDREQVYLTGFPVGFPERGGKPGSPYEGIPTPPTEWTNQPAKYYQELLYHWRLDDMHPDDARALLEKAGMTKHDNP